tara:strand:- start:950 stop:1516 length:567 start_codon:yes stop_codon:yes gene_type:complete
MKKVQVNLPVYVKLAIGLSILGVVGFVTYKIYKKITSVGEGKDEQKVLDLVDKELKDRIKAGETLSKALSTYQSTANSIEEKLKGCELTDEPEVAVIKLVISQVKKPIDWLQLTKAFGKRKIPNCLGFESTEYELGNLLKDQLDTKLTLFGVNTEVKADNFYYNVRTSGVKTTFDILNIYLKKIGVTV